VDLAKEARALESLTRLLKAAEECRTLFDEARMDYPAPLRRMLGERDSFGDSPGPVARAIKISPPDITRPAGVPDGWIHVPIEALGPQTAVLGVLRGASEPMPVKQVVSEVKSRIPSVSDGSINNVGTRLDERNIIARAEDGWRLIDKSRAPLLNGTRAWGADSMFQTQELAARRREAVLHVLSLFPTGLMSAQLLEQMERCAWLKTPLSKDLIKADMEELQETGKVKRSGNSRKWILGEEAKPKGA